MKRNERITTQTLVCLALLVFAPAMASAQGQWMTYDLAGRNDSTVTVTAIPAFGYVVLANCINDSSQSEVVLLRWAYPSGNPTYVWRYRDTIFGRGTRARALAIDTAERDAYVLARTGDSLLTMKFDLNSQGGQPEWTAAAAPGIVNVPVGIALRQDAGSVTGVVVAASCSTQNEGYNYYTACYEPDGSLEWGVQRDGGASLDDHAAAVTTDDEGNAFVTGTSQQAVDDRRIWTVAYDADGSSAGTGFSAPGDSNAGVDIAVAGDYVFVLGNYTSDAPANLNEAILVRFEKPALNDPASETYGLDSCDEIGVDLSVVELDGDPYVYVAVYENSKQTTRTRVKTLKYDDQLELLWRQYYTVNSPTDTVKGIAVDGQGRSCFVSRFSGTHQNGVTSTYSSHGLPLKYWYCNNSYNCYPSAVTGYGTGLAFAVAGTVALADSTTDIFLRCHSDYASDTGWAVESDFPDSPKRIGDGAGLALVSSDDGDFIYGLRGNSTFDFCRYSIGDYQWTSSESIPAVGRSGRRKKVKQGGAMTSVNGRVYATKGNNSLELWQYDPALSGGTQYPWTQLADLPAGGGKNLKQGARLTAAVDEDTAYVYALKGNGTFGFYCYNPVSNSWCTLNEDGVDDDLGGESGRGFSTGSCLTCDPDEGVIYVLKGRYNEFFAYSIASQSWEELSPLPSIGRLGKKKTAKDGASLAIVDGNLYAMKGNNTLEFWRYNVDSEHWAQVADVLPGESGRRVKNGGALASTPQSGALFALKGNRTLDFSHYVPSGQVFPPGYYEPSEPGVTEGIVNADTLAATPRWNTAGDSVVFVKPDPSGILQIAKAPASGDTVIYLTTQTTDCGHPVWSPGDSVIACEVTDANLCTQIAVVRGGTVTVLTHDTCDKRNPEWVPGTMRLVYEKDDSSYTHIYAIDDTGGTQERLTSGDHDHLLPKPATQDLIAFQGEDEDGFSQVMKLEYTSVTGWVESQLTTSSFDHENPAVAPSAGAVTYQVFQTTGTSGNGYYQIGRMALQGSTTEYTLTSGQADHEYPTITDDGGQLHCVRRGTDGSSIGYVTSTNGYTPITDESADRDHPHVVVNALAVVSSSFEREDGIYKTVPDTTSTDNSMSKSLFPVTLTEVTPNPTGHRVRIAWQVPQATSVRLKVYDLSGQCVSTLVQEPVEPGSYVTVWPGRDNRGRLLAGGVYFLTLETPANKLRRKVILTGAR